MASQVTTQANALQYKIMMTNKECAFNVEREHVHDLPSPQGIDNKSFGHDDVILDNASSVSIFCPELLRDIECAAKSMKINGVGGHQFEVTKTGYLDPLFRVYASDNTHANILSLPEVEEKFLVMYAPQENFIIHLPERDIVFHHRGGMYIAD